MAKRLQQRGQLPGVVAQASYSAFGRRGWARRGLKEIALGHVSASVYGYDTLARYGPRLLEAWEVALGIWAAPSST
ncbi:hypothetical protein [Hymenobacter bucti]|uniref:hypothetical protein n=1 Tax=Hymenobacter bucti TaxID=1844114 RepID=UPI00363A3545